MTDSIDLMLLNIRSPLVDAVCATACECWCEAADLWFEVYGEAQYRGLAAQCGFEAALRAGQFDLAEYFHIENKNLEEFPEFVSTLWREYLILKRNRKQFYVLRIEKKLNISPRSMVAELVRLRFYKEAIRYIFTSHDFNRNRGASVPLVGRCYIELGFHAALMGLKSHRWGSFGSPEMKAMVERADQLLKRRSAPAIETFIRFRERHPAGRALTALLEDRRSSDGRWLT